MRKHTLIAALAWPLMAAAAPVTVQVVSADDKALADVVVYLADFHNIPIIIDAEALEDEGIATDSPVTRTLTGVKLRSALKIILQPLDLGYVIEDDVMKITTAGLKENKGLTEPVKGGGTAGQTFEAVASMAGVIQLDKLNDSSALILVQAEGGPQNLKTVALP